ncbi:MAG: chaperone modulator CbpM [Gammaproteobacteria bacterium]|nr:chaperone modulator CbpM [Gammaproteobacteria bacterium]
MVKRTIVTGILVEDGATVSFFDFCQQYDIPEDVVLDMLEHGLIEDITSPDKHLVFEHEQTQRILSACRLHADLGINSPGVILALELMDELEELRQHVEMLQRHIHGK